MIPLLFLDEIKNSKNIGGLRNVSRYGIKHKIKVPFDKRSVPLTNDVPSSEVWSPALPCLPIDLFYRFNI